jgi:hypothetical protein
MSAFPVACAILARQRELCGDDRDVLSVLVAPYNEPDGAVHQREQRMVSAKTYIFARMKCGSALPDDNTSGGNHLPAKDLDAEAFRLRITTISGCAASFFVCHIGLLKKYLYPLAPSGVDGHDLQFGIMLAMPLPFLVMLAPPHLENTDLVMPPLGNYRGQNRGTFNQGRPYANAFAFADSQNLVERDFGSNVCRYLFYLVFFSGENLILLAAGFYDRIHGNSIENEKWCVL